MSLTIPTSVGRNVPTRTGHCVVIGTPFTSSRLGAGTRNCLVNLAAITAIDCMRLCERAIIRETLNGRASPGDIGQAGGV